MPRTPTRLESAPLLRDPPLPLPLSLPMLRALTTLESAPVPRIPASPEMEPMEWTPTSSESKLELEWEPRLEPESEPELGPEPEPELELGPKPESELEPMPVLQPEPESASMLELGPMERSGPPPYGSGTRSVVPVPVSPYPMARYAGGSYPVLFVPVVPGLVVSSPNASVIAASSGRS
ncbi:hypothetical protein AB0L53_35570 [Nonomuraea sp. NPDC052129]|uniref:hypothetical protein n=1 Tax=Nonomuraea sp. NPDC052129 TaxID=3154651 RepID=UPI0034258026